MVGSASQNIQSTVFGIIQNPVFGDISESFRFWECLMFPLLGVLIQYYFLNLNYRDFGYILLYAV